MYLEPHDYGIYYVNIDLRHQYGISAASGFTAFSFREVDLIQLIFISRTHDMGKNLTECLNFLFYSLEARVFLWRPMLFVLSITLAMEQEDLPQQSILIILRK